MEFTALASMWTLVHGMVTLGLVAALIWLHQRMKVQQQAADARIALLENELRALTHASVGVGRKLIGVDLRLQENEKRTQELALSDPVKVSYNEAGRLLELGADVDDLVANCGLSRPEAELIAALHQQRSSA